jgi:predicted ATP-grasp superfamily ATP-dependent carboligase
LVRHFQYVKLRQHPDEFGTGTFLKSIHNDRLLDISRKIIRHFTYNGIFEIEFLRDEDRWLVLEMNPRTWKSIHFATLCGQNICLAYADYCRTGRVPEPEMSFKVGKTWVDLGKDIPMLLKKGAWSKAGYNRDTYCCVLSSSDPLPFIMEIILSPLIALGI